ncbi:thiamine-phosphate kinase [Acidobacteriota bacterium]
MKLKEIGEFGFIDRIKSLCLISEENVIKPIGDDCAVYELEGSRVGLMTTDMLVENIHFLRNRMTPFELGYKTLAVNLSDIAAMGGTPRHAFLSIAIPEDVSVEFLDELYEGMLSLGKEYRVNVLGGDTAGSKTDLVLNIALIGEATRDQVLYRDGAKPGDRIYVNGCLGESAAGLELLLGDLDIKGTLRRHLLNSHFQPEVFVRQGRFLAQSGFVTACIDLSDGISSDISHVCRESGVGAVLHRSDLPVSPELKEFSDITGKDPNDIILAGGEDYRLLFTVQKDNAAELEKRYKDKFGSPLFCVGEITEGREILLKDERALLSRLSPAGWDHFSTD